jgi:hypothetical protein
MRGFLSGSLVGAALIALPGAASATSTCTAWIEFNKTADDTACVSYVQSRTEGRNSQVIGDTVYFWTGDSVVAVRCIVQHSIIALFAWNQADQPAACDASDAIKAAIQ